MKTHSPPEEKRSTKKLFLPIFLAVILIMSAFGVFLGGFTEDSSPVSLGGIQRDGATFTQQPNGRWDVKGEGFALTVQFGPDDLTDVDDVDARALQQAQKVYLTHEGGKDYLSALADFYQNMRAFVPVFLACVEDGPGCENLPLKTCADAGNGVVVTVVKIAEQPRVSLERDCYTLEGDALFLNKAVDRLLLSFAGVTL